MKYESNKESSMKHNVTLTITSLLSMLFLTLHLGG